MPAPKATKKAPKKKAADSDDDSDSEFEPEVEEAKPKKAAPKPESAPKAAKKQKQLSAAEQQLASQNASIAAEMQQSAKSRLNFLLGQSDLFKHFGIGKEEASKKKAAKRVPRRLAKLALRWNRKTKTKRGKFFRPLLKRFKTKRESELAQAGWGAAKKKGKAKGKGKEPKEAKVEGEQSTSHFMHHARN